MLFMGKDNIGKLLTDQDFRSQINTKLKHHDMTYCQIIPWAGKKMLNVGDFPESCGKLWFAPEDSSHCGRRSKLGVICAKTLSEILASSIKFGHVHPSPI